MNRGIFMKKKIISMITALACAVCAVGVMPATDDMASAESYSDDFSYGDYLKYHKVNEDNDRSYDYIEISECDRTAQSVVIPDMIDGLPVKSIGSNAFRWCTIKSIEISKKVQSIGERAFDDCSNLESIVIPYGVKSINSGTFAGCKSLKSVSIPKSVRQIGNNAFRECESLESLVIPNGVKEFNGWVFLDCKNLKTISIPSTITYVSYEAFSGCSSLKSIKLPDGVTKIEGGAFSNCSNLMSFDIPKGISDITDNMFLGCSGIKDITVPDSVKSIDYNAFANCANLSNITIYNPDCKIYDSRGTISNGKDDSNYYYNGTISGYVNSTAQEYAEGRNYKFVSLGEKPTEINGDSNGDGVLNVRDAAYIARMLANGKGKDIPIIADFNGDNKVDVRDAAAIARYLAKSHK